MTTFETQKDFLRFDPNFRKSLVQEVLPEYFQTSYPNLIQFLEGYYEFLDADTNFGGAISELKTVRDLQDSTLARLDFAFDELALGISQSQFTFPREALRNFGNFFRVKGSLYSADGFFRAFFNENIEVMGFNDYEVPWFFDIKIESIEYKNIFIEKLRDNEIETRNVYPVLSKQSYLAEYSKNNLGVSENIFEKVIWLPSSNFLKEKDIKEISEVINSI